jgi:hypothetical protein
MKIYTHENVTYGFKGQWQFTVNDNGKSHSVRMPLPGGVETAHRVARIVNGSHKRTHAGLDNLGRANIAQFVGSVRPTE